MSDTTGMIFFGLLGLCVLLLVLVLSRVAQMERDAREQWATLMDAVAEEAAHPGDDLMDVAEAAGVVALDEQGVREWLRRGDSSRPFTLCRDESSS